jgi:hypothetical protein
MVLNELENESLIDSPLQIAGIRHLRGPTSPHGAPVSGDRMSRGYDDDQGENQLDAMLPCSPLIGAYSRRWQPLSVSGASAQRASPDRTSRQ